MVIIKTKDGVRFVNEGECLQVVHDKEKKCAEIWPSAWINAKPVAGKTFYVIDDVVSVRYVSDGHDFEYDSAVDEVEKLRSEKSMIYELWRNEFDSGVMLENFIKSTLMMEDIISEEKFCKLMEEWNVLADKIQHKRDEIEAKYKKEGES